MCDSSLLVFPSPNPLTLLVSSTAVENTLSSSSTHTQVISYPLLIIPVLLILKTFRTRTTRKNEVRRPSMTKTVGTGAQLALPVLALTAVKALCFVDGELTLRSWCTGPTGLWVLQQLCMEAALQCIWDQRGVIEFDKDRVARRQHWGV